MHRSIKIISGGQTGADRAGLIFARDNNIPYGGYVPLRRKAEDGVVPMIFTEMTESASSDYRVRTELNVREADCTIVFTRCPLSEVASGSWLTIAFAKKYGKEWRHVDVNKPNMNEVDKWLEMLYARWHHYGSGLQFTINVAGGRESKNRGIQDAVLALLKSSTFLFTNQG